MLICFRFSPALGESTHGPVTSGLDLEFSKDCTTMCCHKGNISKCFSMYANTSTFFCPHLIQFRHETSMFRERQRFEQKFYNSYLVLWDNALSKSILWLTSWMCNCTSRHIQYLVHPLILMINIFHWDRGEIYNSVESTIITITSHEWHGVSNHQQLDFCSTACSG